ncbi:TPA: serine/threonine-protein kinase [Streptococcus suis]
MSINLEFLEILSKIFCGDEKELFLYKSGPQLVSFFNNYFNYHDEYSRGFNTRWRYVCDKLVELNNSKKLDSFINLILSKNYILTELKTSEVDALVHQEKVRVELNKICSVYSLVLTRKDNRFHLVKIDQDLVEIGKGGFANIYLQKSTGLVLKKLNDESVKRQSLRSRLKREFEITKSCSEFGNVIEVYDFNEGNCSYTMERAEMTLYEFIISSELTNDSKLNIIRQVLHTMSLVHENGYLHRDLSPTNIFKVKGVIKIADFGLGKNLNTLTSHQTMDTASFGQLFYCAPEQLTLLKDADKRSDVYSLGRIINFIMTETPTDYNHYLRSVCEKATSLSPEFRYQNASEMLEALNQWIIIRNNQKYEENMWLKISNSIFDSEVEAYIYELQGDAICKNCISKGSVFVDSLIQFMKIDDPHANHIIQLIYSNYESHLRRFEDGDSFAVLSYRVLKGDFSYIVNETAAKILYYVAYIGGRFHAQDKIEELKSIGIEPMIESILEGK